MIEFKRIIDSNRWFHAWVYLMYTGIRAWYFLQNIKWKKKESKEYISCWTGMFFVVEFLLSFKL